MTPSTPQPRVRRNEWDAVPLPADPWTPTLGVSVVIPAYDAGRLLPVVLAGLAAQTYPAHLLEVIVVDDGPGELVLPALRPERTRLVRVVGGWGRANACHTGALAADGDVLHWLDADMLTEPDEVEQQLRRHHVTDYGVVLGDKTFVDATPALARTPEQTVTDASAGLLATWFDDVEQTPHEWVEQIYGRTDDLRRAGPFALRTHTGAASSLHRALYLDAGGMDTSLRLGEDIALGHRLHAAGAYFAPERRARSWHLGRTHVMSRRIDVNEYNDPFLADQAPLLRGKRTAGRAYGTAYAEIVLDTRAAEHPDTIGVVDAVLASTLHDVVVTLLGDWSRLHEDRRSVLEDDDLGARIVRQTYVGDPRVRFAEDVGPRDATFRILLDGATWAPRPDALERLLLHVEHTHDGVRDVVLPDGGRIRVERGAAWARARRLAGPGEDVDALATSLWGRAEVDADVARFAPVGEVVTRSYPQTGGPPLSDDAAWSRVDRALRPSGS